jgi:hypothetical protein
VDFVGLHLYELALLHDGGAVDGFRVRSGRLNPFSYSLGLKAKGGLNSGNRTAMTHQRDDTRDGLIISTPSVEGRAGSSAKRFLADLAPVALSLARVDTDVALSNLPSCRAVHIRAECGLRIDGTPPFGVKHRKCVAIRSKFQLLPATTV